jgi:hypothetical protein
MFTTARSFEGLAGRLACVVSACGLAISAPALAAPDALDYVPKDAAGVVAINNLGNAMGDLRAFMAAAGIPAMGGELQAMLDEVGGVAVDAGGSAAFFFTGGEGGESIMLLPVSNYKEFVTSRGGVGAGVEEIAFGGQDVFVKMAGDNFAALSNMSEPLEDWQPTKGHKDGHVESMGTRSLGAAESADVFIVGSITALAADWRESYEGMKGMAMFMAGPEAAQGLASLDPLVSAFLTDARTGVVALDFEDDGVTARVLSSFKEGSLLAGLFSGKSDTSGLLERLPQMPFAFAIAYDTSSPAMRSIMGMVESGLGDQPPAQAKAMMDVMNNSSGGAMLLGAPSMQEITIGAGAFVRSAAYYRSNTPDQLKTAMAQGLLAADGQKVEQDGMTISTSTSYRPEARTIEGVTVDEWGVSTNIEGEANEQAQQAQMAMSSIFGSNGLGGYVAPSKDGVVMTMSRNSQMLTQTLGAANNGGGLGASEAIAAISNRLPGNRALEVYVGFDQLLGIGAAFLGDIPPMPPIGIVAASGNGTAEIALHISPAVIAKGMELGMQFGPMMGGGAGMEFEDEDDSGPAF